MRIWESALLTVLGGLMAAGAGLLAAVLQGRQAARARAEQQSREDRYRLHQDRVAAYLDFHLSASNARGVMQDVTGETEEADAERRAARNATQHSYVMVMLIGGAETIAAARRTMVYIDGVVFRREPFDAPAWSDIIGGFQQAARYDLTGHRDLAEIWRMVDWPPPPPRGHPGHGSGVPGADPELQHAEPDGGRPGSSAGTSGA
ncbi:hypothetical protein [Plantactinospora endophytica]|uniref:DUF4760 domain-containing protein n=1 Tax=Plantactinospora endophytica TaxID=673535 RepID=A0ABQ4E0H9_9ACTN|nr:hypothetical protein [Plantactinospora endophytica]GIG88223.1 hypothetical protein Pen02_31590 [Plantactinospora endophytica]